MQIPDWVRRASAESRFGFASTVIVIVATAVFGGIVVVGEVRALFANFSDTTACNDGDGNPFIERALVNKLPPGTLRAYMNTGSDCDDRSTGSVAAAWGDPSGRSGGHARF